MSQYSYQAERVRTLMERDLPPVPSYIAPAVLPLGGIMCFGGQAKVGKSILMLEMAHALISGEVPFGCPEFFVPQPVRVLIVEQELGEHGLRQRAMKRWSEAEVERLGKRFDNLFYVSKVPELKLDTSLGQRILREICDDVKPNVLILDPIGRLHSWDENSNQEVEKLFSVLGELQKSQEKQNLAILFSQHFSKPKDERFGMDPLDAYNFRGASKWKDNPDTLLTVQRCAELATQHESWSLKIRFLLRHGECPDDMILHVNQADDMRARYVKHVGGMNNGRKALPKPEGKVLEIKPQQGELIGFRAA